MQDRIRQIAVIVFAVLDIVSSFWLGNSLDQGGDATPVYFLPFGPTFAIWGIIFMGQLIYAVYQALPSQTTRKLHRRIGGWVALNAALTALWNFTAGQAGQQGTATYAPLYVVATVFILVGMLYSLIRVFISFREVNDIITRNDRWYAQIPLTIFFAWLNVAAIANTTAALDAIGFTSALDGAVWATLMLAVASVVVTLMIFYSRPTAATIAYAAVIVWAAIGIYFNNVDRSSLLAIACLVLIVIVIVVTIFRFNMRQRPASPRATGLTS